MDIARWNKRCESATILPHIVPSLALPATTNADSNILYYRHPRLTETCLLQLCVQEEVGKTRIFFNSRNSSRSSFDEVEQEIPRYLPVLLTALWLDSESEWSWNTLVVVVGYFLCNGYSWATTFAAIARKVSANWWPKAIADENAEDQEKLPTSYQQRRTRR